MPAATRSGGPASWTDGKGVKIGTLAASRKACAEGVMKQERESLAALESAVTWAVDETAGGVLKVAAVGERELREDGAVGGGETLQSWDAHPAPGREQLSSKSSARGRTTKGLLGELTSKPFADPGGQPKVTTLWYHRDYIGRLQPWRRSAFAS